MVCVAPVTCHHWLKLLPARLGSREMGETFVRTCLCLVPTLCLPHNKLFLFQCQCLGLWFLY